jgi:hypothetical protein
VIERKQYPTKDAYKGIVDGWLISLVPVSASDSVGRVVGAFRTLVVGAENIASGEGHDPTS